MVRHLKEFIILQNMFFISSESLLFFFYSFNLSAEIPYVLIHVHISPRSFHRLITVFSSQFLTVSTCGPFHSLVPFTALVLDNGSFLPCKFE